MPAKKEAVALQKDVCNQEQWDDVMASEGLFVIDVYQKWCGPSAAVVSLFRRLKNEIGDDLLKFVIAEADSIENLEKYRGHCEPCFLFYGSGHLVDVVRGANGPGLQKSITTQLASEHRVLEEGAERKVIKDPLLAAMEAKEQAAAEVDAAEKRKQDEEAQKPVPKELTIVLVKPDAVKEGKVEEIIQKLLENGLEVLAQEEKTLTEDEARDFYKEHEEEEHFDSLVQFMSSGPSHILVLTKGDTGEGVVHEVRALIGPKDVAVAKEEAPDSLRALYGTDTTMNALHGADSAERAARELSFFFPNFAVPLVPGTGPPPKVQKTLALIRPDTLQEHKDNILEKIKESGFKVCLQKEIQLSEDQAKEFYKQQEGQPHFDELINHMTSGPVLALGLAKEEAIQNWRNMLGPTEVEVAKQDAPDSLRAQFSLPDATINCAHGSDSFESAQKELNYFFPTEHTLAVIKPDASVEHKDAIIERIHEAGFNIACQKNVELDRELAEQLYKEHEGKEFFESLLDHMTSGPSMIMVLSREDAIQGWRTVMGPTDPELAKEQSPESLRALLGKDVLQNAIHGSSDREHAKDKIQKFFPEVEIGADGSISVPTAAGEQQDGEQATEQGGEGEEQAPTTEDIQQEGQEPQGGDSESPGEGDEQAPEGGDVEQTGTQEGGEAEAPGGGEGEGVEGESAQVEEGGEEKPSIVESKDEQTAEGMANQAQGEEEEIQEQRPADGEQTEVTEPTADEGGEPHVQEEPASEPAQEEGQQEEQPEADQTVGEAADTAEGNKTDEPAVEQTSAPEDVPAAEDAPIAEDTPAAEEQTAAEDTPAAEEQTAAEDTPADEDKTTADEQQAAEDAKPAEEQAADEAEQPQDEKPDEEPAAEQQEAATTEGGEQEEMKEEQPLAVGDEQKEEPAEEGEDEKKEEPPAEA